MEITKYKSHEVLPHIRHDLRELPDGKSYGNESIDRCLSKDNYSLINHGNNANDINHYRHKLEKKIFKYNRDNLVHAIEVVIQCPSDCPDSQKEDFFKESYKYICSTLPMGEECILVAEVHRDEKYYTPDGKMISKDHIHIMYVPAVPDNKHPGYEYKLCADSLTKKKNLYALHPGLQKHLNDAGIHTTVYSAKSGKGKTIALPISILKEITAETGVVIDKSLSTEKLVEILKENTLLKEKMKSSERTGWRIDRTNSWDRSDRSERR